ncbi:MAG: hypothetical protein Kow0047_05860 [Anaerolineae bacterium]
MIDRRSGTGRVHAHVIPWASTTLGMLTLLISLTGLILLFLNRDAPKSDRWGFWGFQSLMGIASGANGILITRRYPRHPIGWLLLLAGFSASLTGFSEEFALYAKYARPAWLPIGVIIAGVFNWWWIFGYALPAIFIPLLFPNGRFLTPRWRIVAWLGTVWVAFSAIWMVLYPGPMPNNGDIENPFGLDILRGRVVTMFDPRMAIPATGMFLMLAAAVSLILRYRRSQDEVTRHQLRWLAFAALIMPFCGMVGQLSGPVAGIVLFVMVMSFPVAMAIAILRYHLYDIDIIISRTLVYGALVALIVGVYVVIVGATSLFVQTRSNWGAAIIAAGIVAALFHPVRTRLRRGVDRLLYGRRDQPLVVLSEMGARMEAAATPEEMLPMLVETVARELKLPYVAVGLESAGKLRLVAESGHPTAGIASFPLVYQGEQVGRLLAAPRWRGESFNALDVALLENVARQAGAVAYAVRLTADLRRSRQRLVTAREEERRRLRRDLHDGLGPHLASMIFKLDAARNLLTDDPTAADALLSDLKTGVQSAIADIRRLVYGLRPPALDELGLAGALREHAASHSTPNGLRIRVDVPEVLPPLPAAVEVAAYRIALEALTNVVRHAQARECLVRLSLNAGLSLEVTDDGIGLPSNHRIGVGLASMRERAAELGGLCVVEARPEGGTRVWAKLPVEGG